MKHWLVMQGSDGTQRPFEVSKPRMVIGREPTCDVRVPLSSVAQKHCQITLDDTGILRVQRLAPSNGTLHNGEPLEDQETALSNGDRIAIGPVTFVVRIAGDEDGGVDGQEIVIERE